MPAGPKHVGRTADDPEPSIVEGHQRGPKTRQVLTASVEAAREEVPAVTTTTTLSSGYDDLIAGRVADIDWEKTVTAPLDVARGQTR